MTARVDPASGSTSVGATRAHGRLGLQVLALAAAAALTLAGLVGITMLVRQPGAEAAPTPTVAPYLVDQVRPAAAIELTGADGRPFSLASMRGRVALVFFGYTHCPDVCPATVGIVGQVIDRIGSGVGAVFVSVDPERDTVAWLAEYLKYVPKGFAAVTGPPAAIRSTADAWGAKYARVEGGKPGEYSMTHTANVYVVDQQGLLRAIFPFGTQPEAMTEVVQQVLAHPAASVYPATPLPTTPGLPTSPIVPTSPPISISPTAAATTAPTASSTSSPTATATAGAVRAELVSSSVWSGGASPVILALYDGDSRLDDVGAQVQVQLTSPDGTPQGSSVPAIMVRPPGVAEISYVAVVDIPSPGWWRLSVSVSRGGTVTLTAATVAVLDPGSTAALGQSAPTVRTPTLADVGGNILELTTDPAPDRRLYGTSTGDALAAHQPFVLVIDSTKFRTSPACGKALVMARYMQDRWTSVPFIHLEPFEFTLVSDTAVLLGTLSDPTLIPPAAAWGIGPDPWGATSMPWIFVVDGNGLVRAKYQGVIGSADVDVLLSLIAAGH